jgi:hypothetical protein
VPTSIADTRERIGRWLDAGSVRDWMVLGVAAVLLLNLDAFSGHTAVLWDARDDTWFFLRFFGSALREGHFGDFLPNVGSGYPVGGNIVSGAYNPVYLLMAVVFPSSALSINVLYLILQMSAFVLAFLLGRTFGLSATGSWFLGLSMVASGFFVGHASHPSYLSSGVALLACLLGLRLAVQGRPWVGAGLIGGGTWQIGTTGSPEHMVFGAHVLALVGLYHLIRSPHRRAVAVGAVAGVSGGLLLASPALAHFLHQVSHSQRAAGMTVDAVLTGSMPPMSLLNLVDPFLRMWDVPDAVDPTMNRFHLLTLSPFLLLFGALLWRRLPRTFLVTLALAGLFTLLALGRHSPVPLRAWLAELFFSYRIGRFPSGQHRGFALFCLALASALVFDWLWTSATSTRRLALAAAVAIDFAAVMSVNAHVRYGELPPRLQGTLPRFKVEYRAGEESLINAPRDCRFAGPGPAGQKNVIPDRFSWSGYTNLISGRYLAERESMRWALCGESRLWQYRTGVPQPFALDLYSPGYVKFSTPMPPPGGRLLLWAEVDDGFWHLRLNGRDASFVGMPADLRGIDVSLAAPRQDGRVDVEMTYRAPLSRLWRR